MYSPLHLQSSHTRKNGNPPAQLTILPPSLILLIPRIRHRTPIQFPKRAIRLREQLIRTIQFDQSPLIEHSHFIEIGNCVQFVRHGDDGVTGEFLADDALDQGVGDVVEAVRWVLSVCGL